ncbi:MAG: Gfo/Idh/MocA family oxidoreductase [Planctomycetota bacterium]|nr:Gfo/Idh/MocA family oxidoreductase [Planctomycetota bacterium]MDA1211565.1 Gfo/Idh/MocA family oxidoreductase [Planctomycetota bacterium]
MIRIGIIGIGFMGFTHFEGAKKVKGAKVTAIATRNPKKLAGDWTSIQGNFGPRGGHVDLSQIKTYADYHDLLADPDIDLVDICLPTEYHEEVAIAALKAKKPTLVEKPIAVDLLAANRIVQAAGKANRLLMVAQVLPFFPEFSFVREAVHSGRFGKLLAGHFRRVITPPKWSQEMSDFRRLGGWGVDLHIHDNHFICAMCGVPQHVFSQGLLQADLVNHVHTQYLYGDNGPTISCVSGGIAAKGLEFSHGFELFFEKATVQYDAGTYGSGKKKAWVVNRPLTVIGDDGKVTEPKLKGGAEWCAAFTAELQMAIDAVSTGDEPILLSGKMARDALKICYAEAKSIATGKPVKI